MKNPLILFIALLSLNVTLAQTEVGEATLPNTVNFGSEKLVLNGAGIRKKAMVLKLYSGGLYLITKSSDAKKIVNAHETMAIKLVITSSFVSSEAMSEAVKEGFETSMDGNTSSLTTQINKFISFFSEEIVEKDTFDITYQKDKGIVAYKNGKELGSIPGMNFKMALFGIWLGDDSVDSKLKKALLGN